MADTNTALVPVEFHGATIYAITVDGVHHVAINPICEAIGIDWEAQRQRIKRNSVLAASACVTKAVAADGKEREVLTLPLTMLNGWLFGVNPNRVKPELRPKLIQYQRECFDVLARHFMPTRPANPAIDYDRISPAQAQDLKEIVAAIVQSGTQSYGETWARLQRKFRVNSYLELPATKHLEARAYLMAKLPNGCTPPPQEPQHAPSLLSRRWLITFDDEGRERARPLDHDAFLTSADRLPRQLADPGLLMTNAELLNIAAACTQRVQRRLSRNSDHALHVRQVAPGVLVRA